MYKSITLFLMITMTILLGGCQFVAVDGSQATVVPTATTAVTTGGTIPNATTAITATDFVTDTSLITGTGTVTGTGMVTGTGTSPSTAIATATPSAAGTQTITSSVTTTGTGALIDIPTLSSDMSDMTIAEIISTTAGFQTLATAVETAGLFAFLDAPGPITLFAPTDNAFVIYPAGTIDELLATPAVLLDLLQYHIIIDSSPTAQLAELSSALTYLGEPVDITIAADGAIFVNDVVIVQSDIQAANGIIHVINGLLVPPTATGILNSRTVNPQAETDTGSRNLTLEQLAAVDTSGLTILEIISSIDGFTTLRAAMDAAGLNDALSIGGPITLLAPTNGAFAELPEAELESLLNTQTDDLLRLLQYHTILDGVTSADLAQLGTALTATGDPITVTVDNDGVIMLNGGAATVYMADIEAANGMIHAISAVLTPPAP